MQFLEALSSENAYLAIAYLSVTLPHYTWIGECLLAKPK